MNSDMTYYNQSVYGRTHDIYETEWLKLGSVK